MIYSEHWIDGDRHWKPLEKSEQMEVLLNKLLEISPPSLVYGLSQHHNVLDGCLAAITEIKRRKEEARKLLGVVTGGVNV